MNIAHIREDTGEVQSLEDHLRGTADLCEQFTSKIGAGKAGRLLGLVHDLGKACEDFNLYITSEESGFSRGEIDHSTAGAQYLYRRRPEMKGDGRVQCMSSEMLEMAILSHHSGLIDSISADGVSDYLNRICKDSQKTHYDESLGRIDEGILADVESVRHIALTEVASKIIEIKNDSTNVNDKGMMRLGLLVRFLLGCLIDADRIDTATFQNGEVYCPSRVDWAEISERVESIVCGFSKEGKVSQIRSRVSEGCLAASERDRGIFTLSVPTGGGKTISSFRFAVNHAKRHGMDRIIYVVPYLSIIEQNASVIREIVNNDSEDDLVTECHSNVDSREESMKNDSIWRSAMDSWDAPIIFTSMVQFLEVLFSSGTKKVRRIHNLANSVIIFDEIQSLPVKTTYMFNEAVSFLTRYCGSTAVLCTATQPLLGSSILSYPLQMSAFSEIIEDVNGLSRELRRTQMVYVNKGAGPMSAESIALMGADLLEDVDSVLIVANTKAMAKNVFERSKGLVGDDVLIRHLSTNMCPIHRKEVLDEIITSVGKRKVLCVSTQLIEAGVDVDFDSVIRCMAGLDSIAQAAGRCNRHGRRSIGNVYVVRTDENLASLVDISEGRRCSEVLLSSIADDDPTSPSVMGNYFEMYFYKRRKEMSYPTVGGANLFDYLSINRDSVQAYETSHGERPSQFLLQSFKTANRQFHVIDKMDGIIVPYDEISRSYIRKLASSRNPGEIMQSLRILQKYSVNTYCLDDMIRSGIAYEVVEGSGIYCLADGYYDNEIGVTNDPVFGTMMF